MTLHAKSQGLDSISDCRMRDRCTLGAVSSAGAAAAGRWPARQTGGLIITLVALALALLPARCYPLGALQVVATLRQLSLEVSEYFDSAVSEACDTTKVTYAQSLLPQGPSCKQVK